MQENSSILAGRIDHLVWIQVIGRGTLHNSPLLKKFTQSMIERGERRFVVDLQACPLMDSTFMGTLSGLAIQLSNVQGGELHLTNLQERTLKLLQSLGLDQVLHIDIDGSEWSNTTQRVSAHSAIEKLNDHIPSREKKAEIMLEAHENLGKINPDNIPRFRDVMTFLREDLKEKDQNPS